MPTYTLKDNKTNVQWDVICSWDELQIILDEMKNASQVVTAPLIVGGVRDVRSRVPDGFKDVLSRVKSGSAKSNTINS